MDPGTLLTAILRLEGSSRSVRFNVGENELRALVPGDSVFFSIKDILFNREYEYFPEFELTRPRQIVVDAGAHAGLYTLISSRYAKKVVALEPDVHIFSILSANVARNKLTNALLLNSALWTRNDTVGFYRRQNSQLGSLEKRKSTAAHPVHTISLRSLLETVSGDVQGNIDLLKLDIEGTEFGVISSSDENTLGRVSKIVAEIHTEHGSVQELTRKLKACGFSYVIARRPLRKAADTHIRIVDNNKVKFLLRMANLVIELSQYSDWSSLMLFASREPRDFRGSTIASLKGNLMETSHV